eukprot:CAMPEP_0172804446 /NCGR_PEP_ID=MMETSP1075-20121228/5173_1 /TAXON_ID=2916 /ORGANISM="Ceratium fusus, Strain PA161109" /LENGTH=293 /DNA_ID=CAMNT_0013643025 /DNA_START=69 /DNA_END=950 /DNA_ORIENTATION=+
MCFWGDVGLVTLGSWFLVYRIGLLTRCSGITEILTTCCCGLSLALLAPLCLQPAGLSALGLAVFGVLASFCHPMLTALMVSVPLGVCMGAFIWQLGCLSPEMHGVTLGVTSLLFSCIFVCVPYISGQLTLEFLTLPLLSALMLVVGSADLVPGVNALNLESLLSAETAAASVHTFKIWSLVWILALGIQCFLARIQLRLRQKDGQNGARDGGKKAGGSLVASLLPSGANDRDPERLSRPEHMVNDRFQLYVQAIHSDEPLENFDLTEDEKKLVEVCRQDEFERDRVIWGGGLL